LFDDVHYLTGDIAAGFAANRFMIARTASPHHFRPWLAKDQPPRFIQQIRDSLARDRAIRRNACAFEIGLWRPLCGFWLAIR
jgi:hypothetical protein